MKPEVQDRLILVQCTLGNIISALAWLPKYVGEGTINSSGATDTIDQQIKQLEAVKELLTNIRPYLGDK